MCDFTTHTEWVYLRLRLKRTLFPTDHNSTAGWPNGKALDYESRDCRFDPCKESERAPGETIMAWITT
ncbi:unnamed protein product [Penicillium camemberti]|uniref:Str. FM013 n=1 Tax=Penicillium camemberti (strain FM 013) TaxID=1429867 RepID=A0A0G4PRR6_PENC3|nr:unnamed protein product [Penicillium camemberti]